MSGGGRTGRFLGAEHWGVAPDIIAISKGFGAGYAPLGAMIAHDRIVEPVLTAGGFMHGHTYAGNPLACAAGLAVLEEIEAGGMMENAASDGRSAEVAAERPDAALFLHRRRARQGPAAGLRTGRRPPDHAPLPKALNAHSELVELAYQEGLIIYSRRTRGGTEGDHFLVCPPMITTAEQVEEIMAMLTAALDGFAERVEPALKQSA